MNIPRVCTVDGCEKKLLAKGWCAMHWWRVNKYDSTDLPVRIAKKCNIPDCTRKYYGRGLCSLHHQRLYKYGRTERLHLDRGGSKSHPLNQTYLSMLDRCNNPNAEGYENYGGRGIRVCERWDCINGFNNFVEDMGERPRSTTLDRKDNDRGYSPDNCRWATNFVQAINRGVRKDSQTGVKGVTYYKPTGYYHAYIVVDGKRKYVGHSRDIEVATTARKLAEAKYYKPLLEAA